MLQRIKRFQKRLAENNEPSASRPSSSRFSLKRSPLIRELALRVGQGQPAAIVQTVSHAAVAEAGQANVSSSTSSADVTHPYILQILIEKSDHPGKMHVRTQHGCDSGTAWAATLGASGSRPQHIEERLHRAMDRSKDVAQLFSGVVVLVCRLLLPRCLRKSAASALEAKRGFAAVSARWRAFAGEGSENKQEIVGASSPLSELPCSPGSGEGGSKSAGCRTKEKISTCQRDTSCTGELASLPATPDVAKHGACRHGGPLDAGRAHTPS